MFKSGVGFHCNVNNCERTLEFYTEKLGFKVLFKDEYKGQAMVTTNDEDYYIGFAETHSIVPSSTCISFEVEDIEQVVYTLRQKDVEFQGDIFEIPGVVKLATFSDPDGYKLMLSERIVINNKSKG
ncbi:VOC family protein [Desulfosporosinus lacus]|uniref:VOC domain-containing protein n=1 Tax=Desulfosporosinus lacus DSM 15449 TaxID=1121420 RepID=A0A1M6H1A8_9FIRM|nr:VOC family protein [Desulfosporosinus lacus]SHJ16001.1 hypothetical protein SAMN02746098_05263 [Desulfosporosinus lacus DSM 15449]